jgi:hypothetical protein
LAYPDPIPALKGKEAEEFAKRLEKFKLNGAQKEFYREARELFGKKD